MSVTSLSALIAQVQAQAAALDELAHGGGTLTEFELVSVEAAYAMRKVAAALKDALKTLEKIAANDAAVRMGCGKLSEIGLARSFLERHEA